MAFRFWIWILPFCMCGTLAAQHPYTIFFEEAYQTHPGIPRGVLEAISYTQTHVRHAMPDEAAGCSGIPQYVGIMGLIEDGKGVFRENFGLVQQLSGANADSLRTSPRAQILAYAAAYAQIQHWPQPAAPFAAPMMYAPVLHLSELPWDTTSISDFALNTHLYSLLTFLNDTAQQRLFGFPNYAFDLPQIFGANYYILSSTYVTVSSGSIGNGQGQPYTNSRMAAEYPGAIWNPAAGCNYSSRSGVAISAVTVHTVQGSYAGCISWFKNCNAGVSAHYVIRSSDGQVTQMVPEANKAWHVGTENPYTVGIEHEGFVNDPSWYTAAMYQSSASLVKYLADKYNINPLSTYKGSSQTVLNACYRIKGHIHYPNQTHTDPGPNWDWPRYYNLINDTLATTFVGNCTGTITDNGGSSGNYTDLTKYLTVIQPAGATSVTINFSAFQLEAGYDSLYIYDGYGPAATLLGSYTGTQNPGTVTAQSGVLSLLFTSDCSVNQAGFVANWNCTVCPGSLAVQADSVVPASCNPGYIRVAATGGTPPYSYVWGNGTLGPERVNMPVGAFTVSVTDANGCTISRVLSVLGTSVPTVLATAIDAGCHAAADGSATATVTGGQGPYTYIWSHGASQSTALGLLAGSYTVTITDLLGCTASASTLVGEPSTVNINADSLSDASCQGGHIALSSTGGAGAPYTYSWSDGNANPQRSGLAAGNYTVTVADANGCTATSNYSITSIGSIAIYANIDSITCHGDATGGVTLSVTGGNVPYTYTWAHGATGQNLAGMGAGLFSVTVADANGCLASQTYMLNEPQPINIWGIGINGESPVWDSITGGNGPYSTTYECDTASAGDSIYCLITVTDATGCILDTTTSSPLLLTPGIMPTTDGPRYLVYPNPTFGEVTVSWPTMQQPQQLMLYNALGQLVQNLPLANNTNHATLRLDGLPAGTYWLVCLANGQRSTYAVVRH